MKESARHIDFLDYIRGVAILSVFLFHTLASSFGSSMLPWDGWFRSFAMPTSFCVLLPLTFGWAGVSIFFVVSGFCIHLSFLRQGQAFGGFFIRRFFRIYPPYLLALLFFALIFPTTRLLFLPEQPDSWRQLINHLLLIHNFNPQTYYGINPSFWSIAMEVQLYLLYPLLLMLAARFGWRRTIFFVAAVELFIRTMEGVLVLLTGSESFGFKFPAFLFDISAAIHWLEVSPFAYWFSWSLGAFIADAYLAGRPLPLVKASPALWFILAILSCFVRPLEPFFFVLVALLTATVISQLLSGVKPGIRVPSFCLTHLRQTGIWSYSIYLLHQPLLGMISQAPAYLFPKTPIDPLVKFSCCVISWFLIMPLGGLWHRVCELPGIALGKWIIQKAAGKRLQ